MTPAKVQAELHQVRGQRLLRRVAVALPRPPAQRVGGEHGEAAGHKRIAERDPIVKSTLPGGGLRRAHRVVPRRDNLLLADCERRPMVDGEQQQRRMRPPVRTAAGLGRLGRRASREDCTETETRRPPPVSVPADFASAAASPASADPTAPSSISSPALRQSLNEPLLPANPCEKRKPSRRQARKSDHVVYVNRQAIRLGGRATSGSRLPPRCMSSAARAPSLSPAAMASTIMR